MPQQRVGWQPSRFLTDRAEAERAFALAEQLGSVNAAAAELGTTWPSLRKAFTRHGLGMPARNPEAVRRRAIAAARQRTGQPATPPLDPVFVALNPGVLPARERSPAELYQWVRREEQYATLGANVVVELYSESHARKPTTRAWAIIRRADRSHRLAGQRTSRSERRHATAPAGPSNPRSGRWRPIPDNSSQPDRLDGGQRFRADPIAYLDSPFIHELGELPGELLEPTRVTLMHELSQRGLSQAPYTWPKLPRRMLLPRRSRHPAGGLLPAAI